MTMKSSPSLACVYLGRDRVIQPKKNGPIMQSILKRCNRLSKHCDRAIPFSLAILTREFLQPMSPQNARSNSGTS